MHKYSLSFFHGHKKLGWILKGNVRNLQRMPFYQLDIQSDTTNHVAEYTTILLLVVVVYYNYYNHQY